MVAGEREASLHVTLGVEVEGHQTYERILLEAIKFGQQRARKEAPGELWEACRALGIGGSEARVNAVVTTAGSYRDGWLRSLVLPERSGDEDGLCEHLVAPGGNVSREEGHLQACCELGYFREIWDRSRADMAEGLAQWQRNVTQNVERHWRELQFMKFGKAEKYRRVERLSAGDVAPGVRRASAEL